MGFNSFSEEGNNPFLRNLFGSVDGLAKDAKHDFLIYGKTGDQSRCGHLGSERTNSAQSREGFHVGVNMLIKLAKLLSNVVDAVVDVFIDALKELVKLREVRPLNIPMCTMDLEIEDERCGQGFSQRLDQLIHGKS